MIKEDLILEFKKQGFSEKIVEAFEKIERKDFIPKKYKNFSYEDIALPIGKKQTISQPFTIAFMLDLLELKNNQKILEIGSGSGYVLALINEISKNSELFGIERIPELEERSKRILKNFKNIHIFCRDGSKGFPEEAEKKLFDRILISATSEKIPQKLVKQLKTGGILVAPVKNSIIKINSQKENFSNLSFDGNKSKEYLAKRKIKTFANDNQIEEYPGFMFVPLIKGDDS